ncbi:hypothetical protein GCM10020000_43970 [Streptomyces olivoverticillatus]
MSFEELRETVRAVGCGLMALGVRAGDRVAVLSGTRPEWTYAQFGALAAGGVVVPVYPTAGEDELLWVLGDSGASVVVCEDAAQAERVAAVRGKLPELRHVVLMDGRGAAPGAPVLDGLPGGVPVAELLARGAARGPSDLCTIIYTSGTTGLPKGCCLTHGNVVAQQNATADLTDGGPGDTTYLYLPLAHVLAQIVQFTSLRQGGALCYFGGRIEDVVAELAEVRPTHLPSVPRLFEKVHAGVVSRAEARGAGGAARLEAAVRAQPGGDRGAVAGRGAGRGAAPGVAGGGGERVRAGAGGVRRAGALGADGGRRRSRRRRWISCGPAASRSSRVTA